MEEVEGHFRIDGREIHRGWLPSSLSLLIVSQQLPLSRCTAVLGTRANRYPDYNRLNYQLKDSYSGVNFFDRFDYFTGYDLSQGFVHYVDQAGSQQMNLTYATAVSAVLKVDTSETNAITGRKSVRIRSKNQYEDGLFIFDVARTTYGCGTW